MGEKDWIEGAKEIIIGALVIENAQRFWLDAYVLGGFMDSIDTNVTGLKTGVEVMLAAIAITIVVFGVYLIVRGLKTAVTNW